METTSKEDELLDLWGAAAAVGIGREGIAKKIREGRLPAQRIGHKWYVRKDDVESLAAAREVRRTAPAGVAFPVLAVLAERQEATVEELAQLIGRPRRTVLGWVQRLDQEGLITRYRGYDPRDPDQCRLTDAGRSLYRNGRPAEASTSQP